MRTRWNAARSVTVWAGATLAGIAVCWLGVRPVLAAVVPDRLVAFPATEPAPQVTMLPGTTPSASPSGRPPASRTTPSRSASAGAPSASASVVIVDGWTVYDGEYTRTFQLAGGTATVVASQGKLELLSATPRPGFVMTVVPTADDRVVVNFTGGLLRISTLDASWRDTAPVATVTEIP